MLKTSCYGLWAPLHAAIVVAALLWPAAARSEEPAPSPARALFNEGRKLASEGHYEAACSKFEESLRLEVGIGTQFNLADCWEHIGRTASAQALFLGAAASAKAVGQTDREQVLRERASALAPRLSRLVVEVKATDPKLRVKRGELPLESEAWGKAIAVDPGAYVIVAKAPGKQTWEKRVEVKAGAPVVTVEIPELKPEATKKAAPAVKPSRAKPSEEKLALKPTDSGTLKSDRQAGPNYTALALGTLGVAGVGVGILTGLQYQSVNDDAKAICPSSQGCTRKQIDDHSRLIDSARDSRTWSYVGWSVGTLSLVGAGALWYFKIPKPRKAKTSWQAVPVVGLDRTVGAAVSGAF
ncbi:MAG TPA: hypothetical protein VJN18_13700 [Polyangiaceae bacterium]|nr:hypothetical protein [Polyangiaceae bacterium]